MQKAVLSIILLIAVVVTAWALWVALEPAPAPPPPAAQEAPPPPPETPPTPTESTRAETPPVPEPAPEPELVLPPLAESDQFVQERLQPMQLPERWLEQGDYVRRLAVLTENATRGQYPRRQLAFLAPGDPFRVSRRDGRIYVDPDGYHRYDRYVAQLEKVDPAKLAGLLETIRPLMTSALGELGEQATPSEAYRAAIDQVLAVPVLEGDVELVQPNVMYQYADPVLEAMPPLKKQVLRMGPENVRRLQDYLRRLARQMGLDSEP